MFKNFTGDISTVTSLTSQLTLFGKSFKDISKDFNTLQSFGNGKASSILGSVVNSSDTIALQGFHRELKAGTEYQVAYNRTMLSASETAQRQAHEYDTLSNRLKSYQRQKDKGVLTEEQYNAKVQATQTRLAALTAQTETLTLKQRLLAGVTKTVATAFNMLKMAAITFAVTGIIALISTVVNHLSDLANNVSKTKEKVKSLTDEFNSAISTANDNAKRIEELIDNYDKLSDGVNNLGENISLTNEEYDEYKSLTNEIADMFPNLIQGYDNEGNAVLNLKGNVEQLRDAYKEAQQEAYNLLIATGKDGNGNDIIKQWQDTQKTDLWAVAGDWGAADVGGQISVSEAIKQLKAIQGMSLKQYNTNLQSTYR